MKSEIKNITIRTVELSGSEVEHAIKKHVEDNSDPMVFFSDDFGMEHLMNEDGNYDGVIIRICHEDTSDEDEEEASE